jgi:hypothetical protein
MKQRVSEELMNSCCCRNPHVKMAKPKGRSKPKKGSKSAKAAEAPSHVSLTVFAQAKVVLWLL